MTLGLLALVFFDPPAHTASVGGQGHVLFDNEEDQEAGDDNAVCNGGAISHVNCLMAFYKQFHDSKTA